MDKQSTVPLTETDLPPPASGSPSVLAVAPRQCGAGFYFPVLEALAPRLGLTYVSLPEMARQRGFLDPNLGPAAPNLFKSSGYLFGGFRELPKPALPVEPPMRLLPLVRDPRDVLVSYYFAALNGRAAFGPGPGEKIADHRKTKAEQLGIDAFVLKFAPEFAKVFRRFIPNTQRDDVFRYETVVFDKRAFVAEVAASFDLNLSRRDINDMVRPLDLFPSQEDPAQHLRRVLPGDHVFKLQLDTILQLDEIFERPLRRFRYRLTTAPVTSPATAG